MFDLVVVYRGQVLCLGGVEACVTELSFSFYYVVYGVLDDCASTFVSWFDDDMWVLFEVFDRPSFPFAEVAVLAWAGLVFVYL